MPSTTASNILREATRELHDRIEGTAFAKAFLAKELSLEAYVGFIRVLSVVQAVLETALFSSDHPLVSEVRSESLRRFPQLIEDIEDFRWRLIPDSSKAVQAALGAAAHIRLVGQENPVALLGGMYVMGGSTKGATILGPLAREMLGLSPGRGLSYLARHGEQGPEEWNLAARRMDQLVTDSALIADMAETAQHIFRSLLEAFEALWPLENNELRYLATTLNPEAGNHPVPQDRQTLTAVLRASERCLAEYPYFLYRYGRRGRLFSDSDGAWLATLPDLGFDGLRKQVKWLNGVLSTRGMPGLLLARHMEILSHELNVARPDRKEANHLLAKEASRMLAYLDERLSPRFHNELARKFIHECPAAGEFASVEAVALISSAVVDETDGLEGAVESLISWLSDPARFSQGWTHAVEQCLERVKDELAK